MSNYRYLDLEGLTIYDNLLKTYVDDKLNKYLPLTGGTLTGALTINGTDKTTANLHFGRTSYNYISGPSGSTIHMCPGGISKLATTGYIFSATSFYPGPTTADNAYSLGTSTNQWKSVYAKALYENGTSLASKYAATSHTHNYAGSSSAGGAATSSNKLNKITGTQPSVCASPGSALTYYTLIGTTADLNNKRYAGDNTGFPVSSDANSILWLGNHAHSSDSTKAGYGGQMGISSNGNIYYRFISNGEFPTTVNGGSWKQLAFTTLATTSVSGLMSASDKTKLNGISSGAEVNVQSDWSVTDTSSDAYIKNKPTIPTIPSNNVTGSGTSGYLAKWNGANSITNGPAFGSGTTTYLRNDGTWATPTNTTYSAAKYNSLGLLKPAYTSTNAVTLTTTSASNTDAPTLQAKTTNISRYYAVEADKNGVPYVNVPWTDTDTISIHKGTAEIDTVNQSVTPNVICSTLNTPTTGTRLQIKLSPTYFTLTQLPVANIIDFYLNNNTTTRYTITKNGSAVTLNNVSTNGVLDLLFITNTSAELIYKSNTDNNYVFYGVCSTAAGTQAKTLNVTEPGFELVPGTKLVVDFINENTAISPTLSINGTDDKSIIYGDGSTIGYIPAGPQIFVFYVENNDIANGVWKCTSTPTFIPSIYATCSTPAATSEKTALAFSGFTGFRLFKGAIANVKFTYANTVSSSLTLNVASTGAKQVYYLSTNYGSNSTQKNPLTWDANSVVQFVYNGTYWIAVNNAYISSAVIS